MIRTVTVYGWFLAALLGGITLGFALAQDEVEEDPLDLVALLVRDAQWERAQVALDEVETQRMKGDPLVRYHTLEGLIAAGAERWSDAATSFSAAIEVGTTDKKSTGLDPTLYLQLAQALLRDERPQEAVRVLAGAPEAALALSSAWMLKAQAAMAAGDAQGSWSALEEGRTRFPSQLDFLRQQVLLLVRLGLYQEAAERGGILFAAPEATLEDVLVLAEALRRAGAFDRAENVLIQGRLRFAGRKEPWVQSAGLALVLDRPREAAGYLGVAAEIDPSLAYEAAEVWRQAGDLVQALRLNADVMDPAKKARQRIGLLIEQGAWDQVVALEPRAVRLDLLADEPVAYGLAYARFRTGELEEAESLLRGISDPKVFALATELRGAMDACREDPGACP